MISSRVFVNPLLIALVITLNAFLIEGVQPELKLVNVVFRHGDRTPDNNGREMFPKDPYINYSFYPTGLGQLTAEGKRREYKLGRVLRFRYNNFLGSLYKPKLVVARSSDFERTKVSLQLVLAGLFPPTGVQRWNSRVNWQPIPTTYTPRVDDNLILSDECPQYLNEYDRVLSLPEVQAKIYQFRDLMSNLTKLTGKKIETLFDLYFLYQTFVAESSLGLPLLEWAYNYFPYGPLFDAMVAMYDITNFTPLLKRLFAGPLIRAMTDNMIAAQNANSPDTKIYLYGGHETNIASLLEAFGVYEPHVPEYSSAIIMELQEIDEEYYVKLLYYQGIPPTIKELTIPGCDVLCPFEKYLDLIEDLIPSDNEMICDKRQTVDFANVEYPAGLQTVMYNLIKSSSAVDRNFVKQRLSISNMMSFSTLNYLSIVSLIIISLHTILSESIQPELKLVNVVFRHGDRTPDNNGYEMFPTDPYLNYTFFPTGLAHLTIQGKKREYELGQTLHSRYRDFLGDLYLPKLVVGHSSDYDRTKMSLQLVLAALFPPTDSRQRWNVNLNWQPIPMTYVPRVDDNFFLSDECPQFLEEYNRILNLPEIKKELSKFKNVMNNLTELTGKKIEKPLDLYYLYHTFVSESSLNLTLPKWAHDYFPDGPLLDGIVLAYNIANFTPLIRRLYAGPMIRAMLDNMIVEQNLNSSDTKIYLYSGHESNIATMLHAFNLYKPHVPAYSSAIILELLEQDKQYYVKLLYYRGIPPIMDELQIPGCELLCPFDKFLDLIQDLIPSDEEMVCDKRQTEDYANTEYPVTLQKMMYDLIKNNHFNVETKQQ
ncbi:uncharacterized protein [Anoplolepis gracilipes]|uniref:uncharacterized protein n=1 Tax=Anoplolepis gracilipes TaxID=354296 RepID=UPI003B9E64C0